MQRGILISIASFGSIIAGWHSAPALKGVAAVEVVMDTILPPQQNCIEDDKQEWQWNEGQGKKKRKNRGGETNSDYSPGFDARVLLFNFFDHARDFLGSFWRSTGGLEEVS